MSMPRAHILRGGLVLVAIACLAASLNFMYQAGCAGDLKTGAVGDMQKAFEIELKGVAFSWLGIAFILGALNIHRGKFLLRRVITAICAVLIGFATFTYMGVSAEWQGVRDCNAENLSSMPR